MIGFFRKHFSSLEEFQALVKEYQIRAIYSRSTLILVDDSDDILTLAYRSRIIKDFDSLYETCVSCLRTSSPCLEPIVRRRNFRVEQCFRWAGEEESEFRFKEKMSKGFSCWFVLLTVWSEFLSFIKFLSIKIGSKEGKSHDCTI